MSRQRPGLARRRSTYPTEEAALAHGSRFDPDMVIVVAAVKSKVKPGRFQLKVVRP